MNAAIGTPRFIIFLDFDGVLHSTRASDSERFRPEAIRTVNRILDVLEASIVLSTAWRMDFGIEKFNPWFKGRIIDSTPIHDLDLQQKNPRFHEIMGFLKTREWVHIPWIAIDDKRMHFPDSSPAYITDGAIGITEKDADHIILMGNAMKFTQRAMLDHMSRRAYKE